MKLEPLKNKGTCRFLYEPDEIINCYDEEDIKSAVEWLKYKDRDCIGNIALFMRQFTEKKLSFEELRTLITIELGNIDTNRNKAFKM